MKESDARPRRFDEMAPGGTWVEGWRGGGVDGGTRGDGENYDDCDEKNYVKDEEYKP